MKRNALILMVAGMLYSVVTFAAGRYWVGPVNGNWNNSANWSVTSGGPGGAGVPSAADAVFFTTSTAVSLDVSPSISSLSVPGSGGLSDVIIYTAIPATITILNNLQVSSGCKLTDSTSENVPFNIIFNGAAGATASILGQWIFAGRVPVSSGGGAFFTAEPGSRVTLFNLQSPRGFNRAGTAIISRNNSGYISSTPSALVFGFNTAFISDNNLDVAIPNATWANDSISGPEYSGFVGASASTILFSGNIAGVKHLAGVPVYGSIIAELPLLAADAGLSFPNGSRVGSNLTINNTNGRTLSLLTSNNLSPAVTLTVGGSHYYIGSLFINGSNTKVALATSITGNSPVSYRLSLYNDFAQLSGTFLMQGNPASNDSSTIAVMRNVLQTGGTFVAMNNAAAAGSNPAAPFRIEMNGPIFVGRPFGTTSQGQQVDFTGSVIPMTGIQTTLRLTQSLLNVVDPFNPAVNINTGVILQSPLQTGRLELIRGTLHTTDTSMLTVTNPSAQTAVITGTAGESYVVGPLVRLTNSTEAYVFPTGGGVSLTSPSLTTYHPCAVIPVLAVPGIYQAEFVNMPFISTAVSYPLLGVSARGYWDIVNISGGEASVQLTIRTAVTGATAANALVTAHFNGGRWMSERNTSITPGTATSGTLTSRPVSVFGPFTVGYSDAVEDSSMLTTCPSDTVCIAGGTNCKAKVSWRVPNNLYPDTIGITGSGNSARGRLLFKGTFNGHGYYESRDAYEWTDAREAATIAGAHLVTITSPAENNFIYSNINERNNYAWIGLYNKGTAGRFAWVTSEPVNFTNWIPGEPNNLYNDSTNPFIYEPYVHINGYDSLSRWNDNSEMVNARFLAEYDLPVLGYKQVSGPVNGDSLPAGRYTVCYDKTNTTNGTHDTCCFTITVTCRPAAIAINNGSANSIGNATQQPLHAAVLSNPSTTEFSVNVSSGDRTGNVEVAVTDILGRVVEYKNNVTPGSTIRFGSGYRPGVYLIRIMQGSAAVMLKLVKQ